MSASELARPDQISLPEPGSFVRDDWELDDYVRAWRELDNRAAWIKGDLANEVTTRWSDGGLQNLAAKLGESTNTLREYRRVAAAWPQDARRLAVPWSVHQVLAAQEDRAALLKSRPKMTVDKARQLVHGRNRPSPEQMRATADTNRELAARRREQAAAEPVAVATEPVAVATEPVAACPHHVCPVCGHEHPGALEKTQE
jgi:hypothetical protein